MQILRLIESLHERLPSGLKARLSPAFSPHIDIPTGGQDQRAAQTMALTAFIVRILSAAIAFFSHILFARLIGQFDYGIYAFVWVLVVIFGNLSCLGFHTTLIRYLPLYERRGERALYLGLSRTSKGVAIGVASLLTLSGIALINILGERIDAYYLVPLTLGFMILPFIALGDMLDGTARANGWALPAMQYTYLLRPILVIACMLMASALGFNASATTAMQAALFASALTTLVQFSALSKRLRLQPKPPSASYDHRAWLRFALPMFFIDGIGFLLTNADVLIVGFYLPPDQVAIYFAAAKTIILMQFVFFAVKAAAGPRFATLIASDDSQRLGAAACQTARWTFWPSLMIGLFLLLVGPWLLRLFGDGFSSGYSLIVILFFGFLIKSIVGPAETLLNMAGKQFICVWLYAITFVTNVTLNVILIPRYGLEGAAIATSLAMALETLLLFIATRHQLGIWINPLPQGQRVKQLDGHQHGQ